MLTSHSAGADWCKTVREEQKLQASRVFVYQLVSNTISTTNQASNTASNTTYTTKMTKRPINRPGMPGQVNLLARSVARSA